MVVLPKIQESRNRQHLFLHKPPGSLGSCRPFIGRFRQLNIFVMIAVFFPVGLVWNHPHVKVTSYTNRSPAFAIESRLMFRLKPTPYIVAMVILRISFDSGKAETHSATAVRASKTSAIAPSSVEMIVI